MSGSIEQKLRDVNEATGEVCSLIYDKRIDRWHVFYLHIVKARQVRENVGCGSTVISALNDALRAASPKPLDDAKDQLFAT